ncbi:unnamed protein product [Pleuronectes platessa]|uniref:Uncharacterized protein n=1 Tax=Pleuronectes platessa TaxID=8262 RepID=A0A9N7VBT1_PLEPL|nr:unnamed protein product [Pleuronectes platessa]
MVKGVLFKGNRFLRIPSWHGYLNMQRTSSSTTLCDSDLHFLTVLALPRLQQLTSRNPEGNINSSSSSSSSSANCS